MRKSKWVNIFPNNFGRKNRKNIWVTTTYSKWWWERDSTESQFERIQWKEWMIGSWVAAFQCVTGRHQRAKEKIVWQNYEILKDLQKQTTRALNKMKILLWWISSLRGHFYNPFPPKLSCSSLGVCLDHFFLRWQLLVGGWTKPSKKYARQNGFIFPNFSGWKFQRYLQPPPI